MALTEIQREAKWKAQDDARTLIQAEVINQDPNRLKLAKVEAGIMRKEKEAEAKALKKIAGQK